MLIYYNFKNFLQLSCEVIKNIWITYISTHPYDIASNNVQIYQNIRTCISSALLYSVVLWWIFQKLRGAKFLEDQSIWSAKHKLTSEKNLEIFLDQIISILCWLVAIDIWWLVPQCGKIENHFHSIHQKNLKNVPQ